MKAGSGKNCCKFNVKGVMSYMGLVPVFLTVSVWCILWSTKIPSWGSVGILFLTYKNVKVFVFMCVWLHLCASSHWQEYLTLKETADFVDEVDSAMITLWVNYHNIPYFWASL